jgi:threonine/homoserine/homoserine lactone efflux protein
LWSGFLTNVLNPKATLFFLAIFSQFITPQTSWWVQGGYALTCIIMTGLWFSLVAMVLTHAPVRQFFLSFSKWIDRVCGGLFILLGLKLAFTKGVLSS